MQSEVKILRNEDKNKIKRAIYCSDKDVIKSFPTFREEFGNEKLIFSEKELNYCSPSPDYLIEDTCVIVIQKSEDAAKVALDNLETCVTQFKLPGLIIESHSNTVKWYYFDSGEAVLDFVEKLKSEKNSIPTPTVAQMQSEVKKLLNEDKNKIKRAIYCSDKDVIKSFPTFSEEFGNEKLIFSENELNYCSPSPDYLIEDTCVIVFQKSEDAAKVAVDNLETCVTQYKLPGLIIESHSNTVKWYYFDSGEAVLDFVEKLKSEKNSIPTPTVYSTKQPRGLSTGLSTRQVNPTGGLSTRQANPTGDYTNEFLMGCALVVGGITTLLFGGLGVFGALTKKRN